MDVTTWELTLATVAVAVVTAGVLAVITLAALPIYARWLGNHFLFGLIAALPIAMMSGVVGRDLGIDNLF